MIVSARFLLAWAGLAFGLWLVLAAVLGRLRVPAAGAIAATVSWPAARFLIWSVPFAWRWLRW